MTPDFKAALGASTLKISEGCIQVRVRSLRPKNYRRIIHQVYPDSEQSNLLRVGKLECGHPFVDSSHAVLIECSKCAKTETSEGHKKLWVELEKILARPFVPPPAEEPAPAPVPKRRIILRPKRTPPPAGPSQLIPCHICGGGRDALRHCDYCHGTGRRWSRGGCLVYPKTRLILYRRLEVEDLTRMGFSQAGPAAEGRVDEKRLALLARRWFLAPKGSRRREHWQGILATHGWYQPPLSLEDAILKYPPRREDTPRTKLRVKEAA